jgi:hypothetical protein
MSIFFLHPQFEHSLISFFASNAQVWPKKRNVNSLALSQSKADNQMRAGETHFTPENHHFQKDRPNIRLETVAFQTPYAANQT